MTPQPTGRLVHTDHGRDLVLIRELDSPIEDVWASITESDRTAKWFASWSGDPGQGQTIDYRMTMEGDVPEAQMLIEVCEPPEHLAVSTEDKHGSWHLEIHLRDDGDATLLEFTHHLGEDSELESIGPGWEYYLDLLVASCEGAEPRDFADYYPAMKSHYGAL